MSVVTWVGRFCVADGRVEEEGPWLGSFVRQRLDEEADQLYIIVEPASPISEPLASRLVDLIASVYAHDSLSLTGALTRSLQAAHEHLREWNGARSKDEQASAGAICIALRGADAYLAQVGPSLAYQRTADGAFRRLHAERSDFAQALGTAAEFEPRLTHIALAPGDLVLLASTQLQEIVPEQEVQRILNRGSDEALPQFYLLSRDRPNMALVLVSAFESLPAESSAESPVTSPEFLRRIPGEASAAGTLGDEGLSSPSASRSRAATLARTREKGAATAGGDTDASDSPTGEPDLVELTAVHPTGVAQGQSFVIDVWMYLQEDSGHVLDKIRRSRQDRIRSKSRGPLLVQAGTLLTVRLTLNGALIDDPLDYVAWIGRPAQATFLATANAASDEAELTGCITVHADSLQIGRVCFSIAIRRDASPQAVSMKHGSTYRSAFASYARPDRNEVLARVQGMQKIAPQLSVFVDVLSLRSGQDWAAELWKAVPRHDVFYLFWSKHARRSEWVEREWRCALSTRGIDFIDPVPLVSPEIEPPPAELAQKHFNDWTLAFQDRRPTRRDSLVSRLRRRISAFVVRSVERPPRNE